MLDDFDSGRKRKRLGLLGAVCAVVLSPIVIFLPARKLGVMAWVAASGAAAGALYKVFPARSVLPDLEEENPDWLG